MSRTSAGSVNQIISMARRKKFPRLRLSVLDRRLIYVASIEMSELRIKGELEDKVKDFSTKYNAVLEKQSAAMRLEGEPSEC